MSRNMTWAVLLLVMSVCISGAPAAPAQVRAYPTALVPVLDEAPLIDGTLTDDVWAQAVRLGPFGDIAGGPAGNDTYALLLRSSDTLYIGFTCAIPAGAALEVKQTRRDSDVYTDESVEVFIDPGLSLRRYHHFLVNADNVQRDEAGDKLGTVPYDVTWNGAWQSATSQAETAWFAEFAIPLADLGLAGDAPALLGLNLCRNDRTTGETLCWSPTMYGFHEPVRFGVLSLPAQEPLPPLTLSMETPVQPALGRAEALLTVLNEGADEAQVTGLMVAGNEQARHEGEFAVPALPAGGRAEVAAPYEISRPGDQALICAVRDAAGTVLAVAKTVFTLRESLAHDYGYRLPAGRDLGLWWTESTYKVHRDTPLPDRPTNEVRLSLAANECEAIQIIARPDRDVRISVSVSDFVGPAGRMSADNFRLFEVAYVPVSIPSDKLGWADDWPDPLPPLEAPVLCRAGRNQPFWLLAHAPPDTRPGMYRGRITVTADGRDTVIPMRLEVYAFALTPDTHFRTAYGVSPHWGFLGIIDPDQRRHVHDLYMQVCRDYRIAPYNPMAHYPMDIQLNAPARSYSWGRWTLEFEQGQQHPWKLYRDGEQVASQRTSMTHFEREGVGWEGSGMSWPYVNTIESVTETQRGEHMRVLDIVAAHTGSAPAQRSFRLAFRVFIPSGDDWFALRLMRMESTDPAEIEVRQYYNIPRTTFVAEQVANGNGYAAWSGDDMGFGMICLGADVGGLSASVGREGVTVSNNPPERFRISEGQTRDGWGPLVVYFFTDATAPEDLAARAEELIARIDPDNPEAYVPTALAQLTEEIREDYTFTHDFTRFDEGARRYLDDFRFNAFNLPSMPGEIGGHRRFTDEYKRLHALMQGPVIEHLRERGWLDRAYAYWFDEPSEEDYPYVAEGMTLLGENCPGLTRLLTEQPEPPLFDVVDLWVPVLSMYRPDDCRARQEAGQDVWWYVCCGPHAPYPNNFVDHPAINQRIRPWMAQKYGVTGELYWATTFYGHMPDGKTIRNPWEDAMTYRPSGGYWGNGDGMLLYPAARAPSETPVLDGPVVSIRWEMLRDGIEDWEYMWTLKQEMARLEALRPTADLRTRREATAALREAREALDAPDRLAESLVKFTQDPRDLLRERERIARAIEACRRVK